MAKARSKSFNYFHSFIELIGKGKKASELLCELLHDYENIPTHAVNIGELESEADTLVDKIIEEVNVSFITPIDPEDIIRMTEALDNVIDTIEDIAHGFDIYTIKAIREEAITYASYVREATAGLYDVMVSFENFKNYKELNKHVKAVRAIEEQGDALYHSTVKALFNEETTNPIEVVKWNTIYTDFERALNDIERAAKLVRGIAIKNT